MRGPPLPLLRSESRVAIPLAIPPRPRDWVPGPLIDAHGRRITYLRASVTDRCSMACVYCMPPSGEDEHTERNDALDFDAWVRVSRALIGAGIRRIRLTGGEPLVRRDVVRLAAMLQDVGATEIALTTNGLLLGRLARALRDAGVGSINVSLDSLDRRKFESVTRGGDLDQVIGGIEAALEAGMTVKVNAVVLGGTNDDELGAIVDWCWSRGVIPRFIELMPIGEAATLPRSTFISAAAILERLSDRVIPDHGLPSQGHGPARYFRSREHADRSVGVISAVTGGFCDSCNRIRITSRGEVRACLASRKAVSLGALVRSGASDADLVWATSWALGAKDVGHRFDAPAEREHQRVGMSLIGG